MSKIKLFRNFFKPYFKQCLKFSKKKSSHKDFFIKKRFYQILLKTKYFHPHFPTIKTNIYYAPTINCHKIVYLTVQKNTQTYIWYFKALPQAPPRANGSEIHFIAAQMFLRLNLYLFIISLYMAWSHWINFQKYKFLLACVHICFHETKINFIE